MINSLAIAEILNATYPDAKCALNFSSPFECLVAVALSAQTTDASVNKVTPRLFKDYPTPFEMANAPIGDIEDHIRTLGLYKNKAKSLSGMAKALVERYGGIVPADKNELVKLPGVGMKTANCVCAECFNIPAIAVDTHVGRVAVRLGLAKEGDEPLLIEKKIEKRYPNSMWIKLHHQIIDHGRQICHARGPECGRCPLQGECRYFKKASTKTGR